MKFYCTSAFACTLVAIPVSAEPIQWSANGHFYEAVEAPNGIRWTEARDIAISMGGDLASLASAEENQWVFDNVASNPVLWSSYRGPWIGGYQLAGSVEPDQGWVWSDGTPWEFTAWVDGEPNDIDGEDKLHFRSSGADGPPEPYWNDTSDTQLTSDPNDIHGFIVEYIPTTGTASLFLIGGSLIARRRNQRH